MVKAELEKKREELKAEFEKVRSLVAKAGERLGDLKGAILMLNELIAAEDKKDEPVITLKNRRGRPRKAAPTEESSGS